MGMKHQHWHPAEQTLPQHMSDSVQKVPVRNEIRRLPFPDAEGATQVGQLPRRVLLVDDDPLIRKYISRNLVAAGYVVRVAFDGLHAISPWCKSY